MEEDVRKTGPVGLKGLNRQGNGTSKYDYLLGLSQRSPREIATTYSPAPEEYVGVSMGERGIGDSKYDTDTSFQSQLDEIGDYRADRQGVFATLGNGIMRGLGTFATSLVDTTAGFVTGAGYAVRDWTKGKGFWEGLGEIGRNPVSQAATSFNDQMREWFPTYRTQAEQQGNWAANIFEHPVNWISDQLDNLGFMMAGGLTGKLGVSLGMKVLDGLAGMSWLEKLPSLSKVRTAFNDINVVAADAKVPVSNVIKAVGAAEKGNTTLLQSLLGGESKLSGEFLADLHSKAQMARSLNQFMQAAGGLGSAIGEGTFQAATDSRDFEKSQRQQSDYYLSSEVLPKLTQELYQSNPELFTLQSDPNTGETKPVPNAQAQQLLNGRISEIRSKMYAQIAQDSNKMAGVDFLLNIPILAGAHMLTFGKYLTSGYRVSRRAAAADMSKGLASKVTGNALDGTLKYAPRSLAAKIGKSIIPALSEGNEEMAQQLATNLSGYMYEDTPDDLYKARHSAKYGHFFGDNLAKAWQESYGDYDQWQQFAAAFMSTALGIPVLKKGGRFHVGLAGGIAQEYKAINSEDKRIQDLVTAGNAAGANLKNHAQQIIANNAFQEGRNIAIMKGDEKKAKDYDASNMISDVISVARTGRINDFLDYIKPYTQMKADDLQGIQNLYNETSKSDTGINTVFPENFDINNEEQRKQVADEVSKRAKKVADVATQAAQVGNDLLARCGNVFDKDDLDYLTWASLKVNNWEERGEQMLSDIRKNTDDIGTNTFTRSDGTQQSIASILQQPYVKVATEIERSLVDSASRGKEGYRPITVKAADKDGKEVEKEVHPDLYSKLQALIPAATAHNVEAYRMSLDEEDKEDEKTKKAKVDEFAKSSIKDANKLFDNINDLLAVTQDRQKFIQMYNGYVSNPEAMHSYMQRVKDLQEKQVKAMKADSLYNEIKNIPEAEGLSEEERMNVLSGKLEGVDSEISNSVLDRLVAEGNPVAAKVKDKLNKEDAVRQLNEKKLKEEINSEGKSDNSGTNNSGTSTKKSVDDATDYSDLDNDINDIYNSAKEILNRTSSSTTAQTEDEDEVKGEDEDSVVSSEQGTPNTEDKHTEVMLEQSSFPSVNESIEAEVIPESNTLDTTSNGNVGRTLSQYTLYVSKQKNSVPYMPESTLQKFLMEEGAYSLNGKLHDGDSVSVVLCNRYNDNMLNALSESDLAKMNESWAEDKNRYDDKSVTSNKVGLTAFLVNSKGEIIGMLRPNDMSTSILKELTKAAKAASSNHTLSFDSKGLWYFQKEGKNVTLTAQADNGYISYDKEERSLTDIRGIMERMKLDKGNPNKIYLGIAYGGKMYTQYYGADAGDHNVAVETDLRDINDSKFNGRVYLLVPDVKGYHAIHLNRALFNYDLYSSNSTSTDPKNKYYRDIKAVVDKMQASIENLGTSSTPDGINNQLSDSALELQSLIYPGRRFTIAVNRTKGKKLSLIAFYKKSELVEGENKSVKVSILGPGDAVIGSYETKDNMTVDKELLQKGIESLLKGMTKFYTNVDMYALNDPEYVDELTQAGLLTANMENTDSGYEVVRNRVLSFKPSNASIEGAAPKATSGTKAGTSVANSKNIVSTTAAELPNLNTIWEKAKETYYSDIRAYTDATKGDMAIMQNQDKSYKTITLAELAAEDLKKAIAASFVLSDETAKNGYKVLSVDRYGATEYYNEKGEILTPEEYDKKFPNNAESIPKSSVSASDVVSKGTDDFLNGKHNTGNKGIKPKGSRIRTLKVTEENRTEKRADLDLERRVVTKMLPQLSAKDKLTVIDGLATINGTDAYGYFQNGLIVLGRTAIQGTTYHEAFHYVFNSLCKQNEREAIFDEADRLYGKMDRLGQEERLAEDFRHYMLTGQVPMRIEKLGLASTVRRLFNRLWAFVKAAFSNKEFAPAYFREVKAKNLFEDIKNGKYARREEHKVEDSTVRRLVGNVADFLSKSDLTYDNEGKVSGVKPEVLEQIRQEKEDIRQRGIDNGQIKEEDGKLVPYAPNGNKSNLSLDQWILVRTSRFKNWFGDWEKTANANRVSLGKEIPNTDKYSKYGQKGETDVEIREVLNETGNIIGTVRMEFSGKNRNSVVTLHPNLTVTGKGYGTALYQYIANKYNINVEESFGEIGKSEAAKRMWDRIYNAVSKDPDTPLRQLTPSNSSKVVDENGEPLVVYRMNTKPLVKGKFSEDFTYFTTDLEYAKPYARGSEKATLYSVFLNIKNPLDYRLENYKDYTRYAHLVKDGTRVKSEDYEIENKLVAKLQKEGKLEGYDGIVGNDAKNWWAEGLGLKSISDGTEYVTFNSNQIKSATDNVGTYSEDTGDIRYSLANRIENNDTVYYNEHRNEVYTSDNNSNIAYSDFNRTLISEVWSRWHNENLRGREGEPLGAQLKIQDILKVMPTAKVKVIFNDGWRVQWDRPVYSKERFSPPYKIPYFWSPGRTQVLEDDRLNSELLREEQEDAEYRSRNLDNDNNYSTFASVPDDLKTILKDVGIEPYQYELFPNEIKDKLNNCII